MSDYLKLFCGDEVLARYWYERVNHVLVQTEFMI